jgi:hypothetical protein
MSQQTIVRGENKMAKAKMVCPISRGACVECAIYRGRHYYLCYSPKYRGHAIEPEGRAQSRPDGTKAGDFTFGMPEGVDVGLNCIRNVEEIVERREL